MAFEYKQYTDGENTYRLPKWRKDLEKLETNIDSFSYEGRIEEDMQIKEHEVGIKHPKNGSFIRIKDDGTIESFTGYGTGIRISSNESLQFFGNQIQVIGKEAQVVNRPNQTTVNGNPLFGEYPSLKEKGLSSDFIRKARKLNRNTFGLEDKE